MPREGFLGSAEVAAGLSNTKTPTPSSVWGRGEKRGRASRRSVKRGFLEEKGGRWAGRQMGHLRHRGVRRGMCNPLQPAHSPAVPEGLGGPGLDQGAPQRGQESFRDPRKRFRVPFSALEALLSVHLASSESSTSLGSSRVDQGCMPRFFFRGRRQWASAHLVSADPARRVGW